MSFFSLLLLAFSLSVSTSVISITACLIALLWLLGGDYLNRGREVVSNRVCLAVLANVLLMLLGLLWSEDKGAGLDFIGKNWKFMLMPLFLTLVIPEKRKWYCFAFLAGMVVTMATTYLAWFGLLQYGDVTPEHITRKVFHVVYNPLLAFAIYFLATAVARFRMPTIWRIFGILLAAVMIFNMFITDGRAGQLVFFVLVGVFLLQQFKKNILVTAVAVAVLIPICIGASYTLSPTFQSRVDMAIEEIRQFESNPNTSIGMRLVFWQNSMELVKESPFIGVGTGDFEIEYAKVNAVNSPEIRATDNPHSQYFLVATRFGLAGLVVMLSVFYYQFRYARELYDDLRPIRFAFPIFFLVIMLTESYLVVYETGFFFSLFSAVLYKKELPVPDNHPDL